MGNVERSGALLVRLFGPVAVLIDGGPLPPLRSRKTLSALAFLILQDGRTVPRDRLAAALWPEADLRTARANLRPVVSDLRRALAGGASRLHIDRAGLAFDPVGAEIDVLRFDATIGDPSRQEEALRLYQGPLLEGWKEGWAEVERTARQEACVRTLRALARSALEEGRFAEAIAFDHRAIKIDPLSDESRRRLMRTLVQAGDRNGALDAYRELVRVLAAHGERVPEPETTKLYNRIRKEIRASRSSEPEKPGEPSLRFDPHLAATELVGREDESREVGAKLASSRLVTLTGIGGIGKTRLALAVAEEASVEHPGGVWMVPLETVVDERDVPLAIASALGVQGDVRRPPIESVAEYLRGKRTLLVLDNCEHLLAFVSRLAVYLLRECPLLRILATSREALGVADETVWSVPPLATPDPDHLPDGRTTLVRVLDGYEGVRLFVERAGRSHAEFGLTAENGRDVARICAFLEGIPLALELAAARMGTMSARAIADELAASHALLLEARNERGTARQETLRSTLEGSYRLLKPKDRLLFERLSVFSGGWTVEAAEELATPGLGRGSVAPALRSLFEKSLIQYEERGKGSEPRYRMLEMVRQYALERLERSGESEAARKRHRNWAVTFAETAEPRLKGADQAYWLSRLEAEQDNLRAAFDASRLDAAMSLRLVAALTPFWSFRGFFQEGVSLHEQAQARSDGTEPPLVQARAANGAGVLALRVGRFVQARDRFRESLSLYRAQGDRPGEAEALRNLGNVANLQRDHAASLERYEESLAILREIGDRHGLATVLGNMGTIVQTRGDYVEARALYEECLTLRRQLGDVRGIGWTLTCLGNLEHDLGRHDVSRDYHEEALGLFRELKNHYGLAWSLNSLGTLATETGALAEARELQEESLRIFRELGEKRGVAIALNGLGDIALEIGDPEGSRQFQEESLRISRELEDPEEIAFALHGLGRVEERMHRFEVAVPHFRECLKLRRSMADRKGIAGVLERFASLAVATGRPEKAARLWGAAAALRRTIDAPLPPGERSAFAEARRTASAELGMALFEASWREGEEAGWATAADEILSEEESALPIDEPRPPGR